jgi:spore coat protein A, manganese oxidase
MSLTRRELMQYGLTASGALLLPLQFPNKALADDTSASATSPTTTPLAKFTNELTFPEVLLPYKCDDNPKGFDYYEIVMTKEKRKFAGDHNEYEFWGYNGMFPGPTIKHKTDRRVKVNFVNKLGTTNLDWQGCPFPEGTKPEKIKPVIHNHGMPSLPQYDGYATDVIKPDHFKTYTYPNNRSATFWYHDHQHLRTMRNVGMGLAGMWILQDDKDLKLNLPEGKYDAPLIFQTPPFTWIEGQNIKPTEGKPKCPPDPTKYTPPTLINGVFQPLLKVDTHKYRFRLLNATATQVYNLVLVSYDKKKQNKKKQDKKNQPVDEFIPVDQFIIVIGTDSGLRSSPVSTEKLQFVMAERYEIIIDFSQREIGSRMALVDRVVDDKTGQITKEIPLICFEVDTKVEDESSLPWQLRDYRPVNAETASPNHGPDEELIFDFKGKASCSTTNQAGSTNGTVWNSDYIEASVPLGTWQKWRLTNPLDRPIHPIHIHLLDFQIVRRTKKGVEVCIPPYEKNSWKDVFYLGPDETIDIVGDFGPHVGKYMIHCHNLNHEDCDMMTNFVVFDPKGVKKPKDPRAVKAVKLPSTYKLKQPIYKPYSIELPLSPQLGSGIPVPNLCSERSPV